MMMMMMRIRRINDNRIDRKGLILFFSSILKELTGLVSLI